MDLIDILLGFIVLVAGRQLFWLAVGIIGFLAGMQFADALLPGSAAWVLLVIGAGTGIIGALLAIVFQRLAFAVAGFFCGAYFILIVYQMMGLTGNTIAPFVIGGVFGAIVAAILMDWAIIVLSVLAGAGAMVKGLTLESVNNELLFFGLAVFGFLIQAGNMRRWKKRS